MLQLLKTIIRSRRNLFSALSSHNRELVTRVFDEKLTYLSKGKLASLAKTCLSVEEARLPGIFIEAGCALGGSTIVIASVKDVRRPLRVYDVFGMIPPPTQEDTPDVHRRYRAIAGGKSRGIRGDKYYGYRADLLGIVNSNLKRFGIDCKRQSVSLVKGLIQDTMTIDQPVAFAHVDVDWYDPVMTCLERIFPKLVLGGTIILDDYHCWGGCRKATDRFLQNVIGQYTMDSSADSMRITRIQSKAIS